MEYKRFGSKFMVRIDKDEEILEKVKELVLSGKSTETIATETGFFDVRTMRRNFRAVVGKTMSEYKKEHK